MSATAQMCAHCGIAAETVLALRAENERLLRQLNDLKMKERRHTQARSRRRVEKRTAQEMVDQLDGLHCLDVVDTGPGRWRAQCPAHDDHEPSLQITEKSDGTVLIHCWAGCLTEQVLESIGWEFAMLRASD